MSEWTIGTELLLFEVVSWTSWTTGSRRRNAECTLATWLMASLDNALASVEFTPPPVRGSIGARPTKNKAAWCIHIQPIMQIGVGRLADAFQALFIAAQRCLVCKEWMTSLGKKVAKLMERQVALLELPHMPVGFPIHRGAKRARRIDEVMKTASSLSTCLRKRRRVGDVCDSAVSVAGGPVKDEWLAMAIYLKVGAEHMSGVKQLSLVCDGSTVAMKDTWLIALYDANGNVGMWLPSQAEHAGLARSSEGVGGQGAVAVISVVLLGGLQLRRWVRRRPTSGDSFGHASASGLGVSAA